MGGFGEVDAAIVAYPHGAAAPAVALRARGVKVIDLSADFRLRSVETYEEWYIEHTAPELLSGAVYGLPERSEELREAEPVANSWLLSTAAVPALSACAVPDRRRHRREDAHAWAGGDDATHFG